MAGKVRELAWSLSRGRMFEECPRRFYYHYYFSQAGYAPEAPEEAKLALEMKRIKGLDMWVGEVVHDTIQWVLEQAQSGTVPSEQDAKSEARRRLSEGWQGSLKQLWRLQSDEQYPNLFDHYYSLQVGKASTDRLKEKTFVSMRNFMDSDILKQIAATPADRWLPIDRFASFRIDGLLMYAKFDFALKDGERLTVYDWKTGKPTQDEIRQLACYAMYTSNKWEVPVENVKVCAVHLQPALEVNERLVDEVDIDDVRSFIKQSFNAMVKCLRNPARNLAVMDDFAMTGNLMRCRSCNFKGICEQAKAASGDMEDSPAAEDCEGVDMTLLEPPDV